MCLLSVRFYFFLSLKYGSYTKHHLCSSTIIFHKLSVIAIRIFYSIMCLSVCCWNDVFERNSFPRQYVAHMSYTKDTYLAHELIPGNLISGIYV